MADDIVCTICNGDLGPQFCPGCRARREDSIASLMDEATRLRSERDEQATSHAAWGATAKAQIADAEARADALAARCRAVEAERDEARVATVRAQLDGADATMRAERARGEAEEARRALACSLEREGALAEALRAIAHIVPDSGKASDVEGILAELRAPPETDGQVLAMYLIGAARGALAARERALSQGAAAPASDETITFRVEPNDDATITCVGCKLAKCSHAVIVAIPGSGTTTWAGLCARCRSAARERAVAGLRPDGTSPAADALVGRLLAESRAARAAQAASLAADEVPLGPVAAERWRVGRKLGRTLYRDEVLVGLVDTTEDAAAIVAAMNRAPGGNAAPRLLAVARAAEAWAEALDGWGTDRLGTQLALAHAEAALRAALGRAGA